MQHWIFFKDNIHLRSIFYLIIHFVDNDRTTIYHQHDAWCLLSLPHIISLYWNKCQHSYQRWFTLFMSKIRASSNHILHCEPERQCFSRFFFIRVHRYAPYLSRYSKQKRMSSMGKRWWKGSRRRFRYTMTTYHFEQNWKDFWAISMQNRRQVFS